MDVSFEYYPMDSIFREEESLSSECSQQQSSVDMLDEWCENPLTYEQIEYCNLDHKQFQVEFDDEKPFMEKVDEACEEVFYCKKHNNYVAMSELIHNSDEFRNFVSEWTSCPDPSSLKSECSEHLTKQITFNVTHMNEHEYFVDYPRVADLSVFDGARFSMYISDNFSNVKRNYAMHTGENRVNIMSGFFVIDGKILDPSRENVSFENLEVD